MHLDGPGRHHCRLFCESDDSAEGVAKPLLVVINGRDKPLRAELAVRGHRAVRKLGQEYLGRNPRSLA